MQTKNGATLVGSLVAITILSITLVAVLNLQASIIRARFFLQHDNTANLLVAEGLEIVRAIHADDSAKLTTAGNKKYKLEFSTTTLTLPSTMTCTVDNINSDCALNLEATPDGIFYRFVEINTTATIIDGNTNYIHKVTSTVIVKSPRGSDKVYKATIKLYTY
jgi:Tfp pilus assembly protein PilV